MVSKEKPVSRVSVQTSTSSSSKTPSSRPRSLRSPNHFSSYDQDVSSDMDGHEMIQQKREAGEMSDRIKISMLQYFGGRQNHKRWVMKCTSKVPGPPPARSIKKIAIAAYENKSIDFFFDLLVEYVNVFIQSIIHSIVHSFIHSFIQSIIRSFNHSLIDNS